MYLVLASNTTNLKALYNFYRRDIPLVQLPAGSGLTKLRLLFKWRRYNVFNDWMQKMYQWLLCGKSEMPTKHCDTKLSNI